MKSAELKARLLSTGRATRFPNIRRVALITATKT